MNFIKVTTLEDEPIYVNFSLVRSFIRKESSSLRDATFLYFDNEQRQLIKETPEELATMVGSRVIYPESEL